MSEGFDNYGLRIKIIADCQYEDGRKVGQFKQVILEPGLEDVMDAVLQLIEGCYAWGMSRLELIEKCKNELDVLGLEFKPKPKDDEYTFCGPSPQDALNGCDVPLPFEDTELLDWADQNGHYDLRYPSLRDELREGRQIAEIKKRARHV